MAGAWASDAKALERAAKALDAVELPYEGEHHYYKNFPEYKEKNKDFLSRIGALLTSLPVAGGASLEVLQDPEDAKDWVAGLLDETFEKIDDAVCRARQALQQKKRASAAEGAPEAAASAGQGAAGPGHTASMATSKRAKANGGFISYMDSHLASRPQDSFADKIDNSNAPYRPRVEHLIARGLVYPAAAEAVGEDGSAPHPLASRLDALAYAPSQLAPAGPPRFPAAFDATPFEFIDTLPALCAAAERLAAAQEIAVDLEAHSYRSFQGFCCLIQISTRAEDMIVDALALRSHLGEVLGPVFADPGVVKVLHGADSDIVWLQRDFGIYVVNMFDTGQAARVLEFPGHGLAYLLDHYCGFKADKRFQLADWRVRPLTEEMLQYARADTHFLLYCYDKLRVELAARGDRVPEQLRVPLPPGCPAGALGTVLERSRRLCLLRYEKELLRPDSWLTLLGKIDTPLNDEQAAAFAGLYSWRDGVARQEDESTGYVLSRANLVKLAQALPTTIAQVHRALGRGAPVVARRAAEALDAIKAAVARSSEYAAMRRASWQAAADAKQQRQEQQHQQQAAAAAGAGAGGHAGQGAEAAAPAAVGAPAEPAAPVAGDVAAFKLKPRALQPRAVKPLLAQAAPAAALLAVAPPVPTAAPVPPPVAVSATEPAAGVVAASRGSTQGGTQPGASARTSLQPRAVKPLALGGGGVGAGGISGYLGSGPALGAAAPVPAAGAEASGAGREGAVPAEAEQAQRADDQGAAEQLQQQPVLERHDEGQKGQDIQGQSRQQQQRQQSRARPMLAAGSASAFGGMLGGSGGGSFSAATPTLSSLKAGFVLPFAFATSPAAEHGQQARRAAEGKQLPADEPAVAAAAAAAQRAQRPGIRAAIEAMMAEDEAGDHGPADTCTREKEQQQPLEVGGQPPGLGSSGGGRAQQGGSHPRLTGDGMAPGAADLAEYLPLPVSQRYGRGGGGGRGRGRGAPRGFPRPRSRVDPGQGQRQADEGGSVSEILHVEEAAGAREGGGERPSKRARQEKRLKRTLEELGLEGSSGAEEEEQQPAGRSDQRAKQAQQAAQQAERGFDPEEARSRFDLGLVSSGGANRGRGNGRGRGRGGDRGRGRGRGGDRGRGGRGGDRGRGGRGRGRDDEKPRMPAGKFNPYGELDLSAVKGGKRSGTMPRSGNRSFSYK
ncbi:hypothetical protein N2152v2_010451 [Parachlorella kessleri]